MNFDDFLKLIEGGTPVALTALCCIVWIELRAVRAAISKGNAQVQEILVKAMTGELRSYADWKSNKPESYV